MRLTQILFTTLFVAAMLASLASLGGARTVGAQEKAVAKPVEFKKCWSFRDAEVGFKRFESDAKLAYVAAVNGSLIAIDIATGAKAWTTDLGGEIVSNVAVNEDLVFVATRPLATERGKNLSVTLRALSKGTGITQHKTAFYLSGEVWLTVAGDTIVVAAHSGEIEGLLAADGTAKWKFALSGGISRKPRLNDGTLLLSSGDRRLFAVGAATGETKFAFDARTTATAFATLDGGDIVYGDDRGQITRMPIAGGKPEWKFRVGAQIVGILPVGSNLIVSSYDNFVYSIDAARGHVNWKRRFAARIVEVVTVDNDMAVVFTSDSTNVAVVKLADGKLESQFVTEGSPLDAGITAGKAVLALTEGEVASFSPDCKK